MQQQRGGVKSLMEIQAEEARKAHQKEQMNQQQFRQQQQQKVPQPFYFHLSYSCILF